jgi:hypothetical protein
MQVHVDEMVSTVDAVDDSALLSPAVLDRIVQAVKAAVREDEAHRERAAAERRIGEGG